MREGEKKSARERESDRGGKYASGRHLVSSSSEREEGPGRRQEGFLDQGCILQRLVNTNFTRNSVTI